MTAETLSEMKARRDQLIARDLEITATLAKWKRDYVVNRIECPLANRVTLEAEQAQIAVDKHQLAMQINEHKAIVRVSRQAEAHSILVAMLNERGMSSLVDEATRRAAERISEEVIPT